MASSANASLLMRDPSPVSASNEVLESSWPSSASAGLGDPVWGEMEFSRAVAAALCASIAS